MDVHEKLLVSVRRGMRMMSYLRHKSRHSITVECTSQIAKQRAISPILRITQMRTKNCLRLTLVFLVIVWAGSLYAQDRETHPMAPEVAFGTSAYMEPFGVPVTPGIYLTNFILLYVSSPDVAAKMPAYRAKIPQEVYECLVENPEGCPYVDMKPYFDEQALQIGGSRNKNTFWPDSCLIDPKWEALVPPEYRQPSQISQPLGREKADRLARRLGITQEMILTEKQYECMIGINPPRPDDEDRQIINACLQNLTNSKDSADIPLSSYGLSLDKDRNVRSNCAPGAPCLEFNQLIKGPLERIAWECDFWDKFQTWNDPEQTPLVELAEEGVPCQADSGDPCIVETANPGNGDE